ncbi:GIY-YIG nuclease family protein [Insolitispirillum peregrinum]|uniref:GIY-YIG nuclease family protein n=1 Tax=Insolitispirillum peregrinum TaxID=80876 RepID=UPI00360BFCB3
MADDLPPLPGAYAVEITLTSLCLLPPRFGGKAVDAGVYLYLGSAYGGGGIRARCRRHLSPHKTLRWHVDWLTSQADHLAVRAFPGLRECALVAAVVAAGGQIPAPGFGSSDCQTCASHLLSRPSGVIYWPS